MAEPSPAEPPAVDIVTMILSAIADVAPDVHDELADLDHDVDIWTTLQLDSMDHLAVMDRLAAQSGRTIEESDYPRLTTINALRNHLST
jgi:hypothetical protein